MANKRPDTAFGKNAGAMEQNPGKTAFQNQNPNESHSTKKVSLGPNTKR